MCNSVVVLRASGSAFDSRPLRMSPSVVQTTALLRSTGRAATSQSLPRQYYVWYWSEFYQAGKLGCQAQLLPTQNHLQNEAFPAIPMTLERVVPALIPSRLVYCNLGTSEATLSRLQLVQNAAAWLLTRSKKRDHVTFLALHLYTSSPFILGQTSRSLNLCNCLQISPQSHNNIHLRISHLCWVLFRWTSRLAFILWLLNFVQLVLLLLFVCVLSYTCLHF